MATVINTTFKLKRGAAARWAELNPILEQGEPGFVYDLNLLKVGDGFTPWNELPYIQGKSEIINFELPTDFPEIGDPNVIYKSMDELSLYHFNPETLSYEKISTGIGLEDVTIICGGRA